MRTFLLFIALIALCLNCKSKLQEDTIAPDAKVEANITIPELSIAWSTDTVQLVTPESVLYDATNKRYFVSCINGIPPTAKDQDGYIAILDEKGSIVEQKWVSGLSAPKGMAIHNSTLYVTDISDLVAIDLNSKNMKRYPIEGAEFLNDIDVSKEGVLYISDSNTNKIHAFQEGKVSLFMQDTLLGGPNGIYVADDKLVMASFGAGTVYSVDLASPAVNMHHPKNPGGDGVEAWADGFFISDWNGQVFYYDKNWNQTLLFDTRDQSNAADIEVNNEAKLLLVPEFFNNRVTAYNIK